MFVKSKEQRELKKEIQYNEAMEEKLKDHSFDASFTKGGLLEPQVMVPIVTSGQSQPKQWVKLDNWRNWIVLLGATILATVLLVVLLLEKKEQMGPFNLIEDSYHSIGSESKIEALIQETTTTTTTTTLKPRLDAILASIIVNNASVPQMDRTFSGIFNQFARADVFVVLHVVDNGHVRRVGRTPADKNTLFPKWNFLFEHEMKLSLDAVLEFELWDFDQVGKDERVGKVFVKVSQLVDEGLNGRMVKREYEGKHALWFTVHWRPVYSYE